MVYTSVEVAGLGAGRGTHPVGDLLRFLLDLTHLPADESFYRGKCVLGVDDALALGDLAHQSVAALCVRHN